MSDETELPDDPERRALGSLGGADHEGASGAEALRPGRRRLPELKAPGARTPAQLPEGEADDRLKLPRGAFVALRKSGGLRFSSREVVVFRDGRVRATVTGRIPGGADEPRRLLADEVTALYQRIESSGLKKLPPQLGRQSPDAYAYELVARIGRRAYRVEFFDGSVPAELEPIMRELLDLIPTDG